LQYERNGDCCQWRSKFEKERRKYNKMINKKFCFTMLAMGVFLTSCYQQYVRKDWVIDANADIYVYRITYGELCYNSITAISLEHDRVYYYANDSLLLSVDDLTHKKRRKVNDQAIANLLHYLTVKNLSRLEKPDWSRCGCVTKNEYVIRILKQEKNEYHFFPELLKCDQRLGLKFVEDLRMIFERMLDLDGNSDGFR